ncbi:MAG: hypothetical protein J0H15_12005 [Xanthomonadales bacterium]|nr:hypothetical protein [Xanthomonadales bacterium]
MRPLLCIIAAGMLVASAAVAAAATGGYGLAFDTLYHVDVDQARADEIGSAGRIGGRLLGNLSGLTTAADGTLYAVTAGKDLKLLLRVDPATGSATPVGDFGLAGQGSGQYDALDLSMAASCQTDVLWLASAAVDRLWRVDRATGATALVGDTGHLITGVVERNGVLYGAGGKGDNRFYRIDAATGAATPVGPLGPALTRWVNSISMAFDSEGVLWAVVNYVPPPDDEQAPATWNDLARIDPKTGLLTIVGPLVGPESLREIGMRGFTLGPPECSGPGAVADLVPVPVDSPLALVALASLLAGAAFLAQARAVRARRA